MLAGATVLSTSTSNFPNRVDDGPNVYLASTEMASVGGILGRLPTPEECFECVSQIDSMASEVQRCINFNQIESFHDAAEQGKLIAAEQIVKVTLRLDWVAELDS